ncbi:hypothetical protein STEG23_000704, partial [Scotinomys teguina]
NFVSQERQAHLRSEGNSEHSEASNVIPYPPPTPAPQEHKGGSLANERCSEVMLKNLKDQLFSLPTGVLVIAVRIIQRAEEATTVVGTQSLFVGSSCSSMWLVLVVHLGARNRVGGVLGKAEALETVCASNPSYFYLLLSVLCKLYDILVPKILRANDTSLVFLNSL